MIRRPPRSTQSRSSAASDVYKRQLYDFADDIINEYNRNMTLNHMVFRIKTYNDEKFDYSITEINLRK